MALQTYLSSCIVYAPSSANHASGSHGSFHLRLYIIPCKKLKGAYIVKTTIKGEQPTYILCTTDRDISNFDLIKYYSDHIPEGLDYENIDFKALME